MAPVLPFLAERLYQGLVVEAGIAPIDPKTREAIDSVHLTPWPADELAADRDDVLESAMSTLLRAVELARMLRGQQGIRVRQPLARLWLALPGGVLASASDGTPIAAEDQEALLALLADELNVKSVELMGDESELVERRVKPLLPVIGRRYGQQIPAIMAAARANDVEYLPDGSVRLGGVTLEPSEVEILASPRPGTAVAHDEGLVVVVDTTISDELRAEGDARELQRAIQDLRKEAGMALDGRIELWLESGDGELGRLAPHLDAVSAETLATLVQGPPPDAPAASGTVELERGSVRVALRPAETLG
jgi:isoleucyl-tRNA synthetase